MSEPERLPARPCVRVEGGEVVANSRDIAADFDKRPADVVRAIETLRGHDADLRHVGNQSLSAMFREVRTPHPTVPGRFDVSYDMTRDGFSLVAMGFSGAKALAFKLRYIAAYNALEATLRDTATDLSAMAARTWATLDRTSATLDRLAIGQGELKQDVGEVRSHLRLVHSRVDEQGERLARVESKLDSKSRPRKRIFKCVRQDHALVLAVKYNGRCEVCRETVIVDAAGNELSSSRGDHAAGVDDPSFTRTWLICADCNAKFGTGALDRNRYLNRFLDYQATAADFFREYPYRSKGGASRRRPKEEGPPAAQDARQIPLTF